MIHHYLYFPSESAAHAARTQLDHLGFTSELRRAAMGDDWLVLARESGVRPDQSGWREDDLTALAERHGGEYDGWETEVDGA